jgi:mannose-6-phosphate isomerase
MNETIYKKHLSNKTLPQILHSEKVKAGDSFFIEPGTVHAIGAGVVLAEIQQTSDITYRIYDYNRPDIGGNLRELHTDLALKAINYQKTDAKLKYMQKENEPVQLCKSPFFQTNKLSLTESINRDLDKIDSFVVYMCVKGDGIIELNGISETIKKGETILIPSLFKNVKIKTNSVTLLEVYIP